MGPGGRMPRGDGRKAKNVGKTLKRILSYVGKEYKFHIIVVFICIIIGSLAGVAGSLFIQRLIDDYITPMLLSTGAPDYTPLIGAISIMAAIYLAGALANWSYNFIMVSVSQGVMKKIRDELFTHMQKLPIKYFDTHAHGDLMSHYTNDTDTLRQMISQSIPQMFSSIITITSVFCAMVYTSIPLTVMILIFVFIMMQVAKKVGGNSAKYFIKQQKSLGKINGYIEEMINGIKVVKVFGYEDDSKKNFDELNEQLCDDATKANRFANILMPILANIGNLQYVMVAFVGGVLALSGASMISVGQIATFMLLSKNFSMPVSQVSQQLNSIAMALAGAERIFNLMDEDTEFDEGYVTLVNAEYVNGEIKETAKRTGVWAWKHPHNDGTVTYTKLEGKVTLDDVDFGYTDEKMVLHNISLYAKPGQKIAFVGATGAGKTTITNLINRFYDIADGKIRYDDININKIKKTDLRRSLGIVLQDVSLFTGTIMENIRYGKLDATDEEVYAAAKLANADGFIQMLPDGYDTVIGNEGSSLSQGQRQLISIARAAVADPPVMILDEATSSIDTRTESIVQKGMDRLMQGRTVFVIAHRLSTIQNSDVIMVLDKGKIIERGNHEDLIKQKGKYYQLYTGAFELE